MLQRVQRRDSHPLVVLKHPQYEVLELEVVGRRVARLAETPTARTSGFHAEDVVKSPTSRRLVLQTVTFTFSAQPERKRKCVQQLCN